MEILHCKGGIVVCVECSSLTLKDNNLTIMIEYVDKFVPEHYPFLCLLNYGELLFDSFTLLGRMGFWNLAAGICLPLSNIRFSTVGVEIRGEGSVKVSQVLLPQTGKPC